MARRIDPVPWRVLAGAFVLGWPVLAVAHQLLVLLVAQALHAGSASPPATALLTVVLGDPVYAAVALQMLGGVEVAGVSLSGQVGNFLHATWPSLFQAPDAARNAWASAVFQPGSSVTGVTFARCLTNALLIALGFHLAVRAYGGPAARHSQLGQWARAAGWLLQAYGIASVILMRLGLDQLEAMGLAQAATKLAGVGRADYDAFAAAAGPLTIALKLAVVLGAYLAIAPALRGIGWLARSAFRRWRAYRVARPRPRRLGFVHLNSALPALIALPLALLLFELGARGSVAYQTPGGESADSGFRAAPPRPPAAPDAGEVALLLPSPATPKPSVVQVTGGSFRYRYTVNGQALELRGVGYNIPPVNEDAVARAARLDRDFRMMRAAGINTILGWDQARYDELLLDEAQRNGIGVILPFDLPETGDYASQASRAAYKAQILAWVERYKAHPALRMWGIGNEIMHREKNPASPRLREVSTFLVEVADAVHAADPNHPVLYREAEDIYLPPLAEALAARPAARPWFVYGMNFYTYRLSDALKNWRTRGIDIPLVVTEFGAPGLRREDRPNGYLKMWRMLGGFRPMVLGGFAYVWYTEGPEPLDATFGLVKADGTPADGTLAALASEFRALEAASKRRVTSGPTALP